MSAIDRIEQLKEAYEWEQDRIRAWVEEMHVHPGNEANPMTVRFKGTWEAYYEEIMASNQAVIEICDDVLSSKATAADAIIQINTVTHREESLVPIVDAAHEQRNQSTYFAALDGTMALEYQARDYIAEFLDG